MGRAAMIPGLPQAELSPLCGRACIAILICAVTAFSITAVFARQTGQSGDHEAEFERRDRVLSEGLLAQDLDAFFSRRIERVGPYADWTYGWASSYAASYMSTARILLSIWSDPAEWRANSIRVIREDQIKSVTQRVLKPQQDAAELSWLVDRQTASRLFLLEMQLLDHSCAGEGDQACRLALHPHLSAVSSAIMADRLAPAAQAMEAVAFTRILSAKADGGADLFHVMRPLTTRLALLVLRLTELASIVLLISAGLRRVYVPNTATTRFLVAIGVAWSLDFALLGIERNWNEQSLKDGIYAGLEAQRRDVTAAVISALDGAESSFLAAARPIVQERR